MDSEICSYLASEGAERRFDRLPPALRERVGSEGAWTAKLKQHSLALQREWSPEVGVEESVYYDELLSHSREACMLYPYHLPVGPSAFEYYCELLGETMRHERSYDTIPNFTAADVMRLLRVGRNEFISMMNSCRAKGWMWKRRGVVSKLLPSAPPSDLPVDHWWLVCASDAAAALMQAGASRRPNWFTRRGERP